MVCLRALKLPKSNLNQFMVSLKDYGEVHIPVRKGEHSYVYARMDDPQEIAADSLRTLLPIKKYLLPPIEPMFRISSGQGYETVEDGGGKVVLFGPHPCEIHSVKILDLVCAGEYPDPYYFNRRKNVAIIGLSCIPDDKCFCRSMGTDSVEDGFDLFLSDLGDSFLVAVGTSLGDDMTRKVADLFEKPESADIRKYLDIGNKRREQFKLKLNVSDLPYILELGQESRIWDEIGSLCLCCGSCSMVCPTCTCFNVYDVLDLNTEHSTRYKQWDSCLFRYYATVAGGHNFRAKRADRVKNRYYHKQQGFVEQYGRPSCVGCGRCIDACPSRIHIVEVFSRIRGEKNVEKTNRA